MPVPGYTPRYTTESPYRITPVVGNFMFYYVHREILPHPDDIVVTMDNPNYEYRPDRLANDFYNDDNLWWVFGVRNGWEDPVHDLKMGVQFRIPTDNYLRSII